MRRLLLVVLACMTASVASASPRLSAWSYLPASSPRVGGGLSWTSLMACGDDVCGLLYGGHESLLLERFDADGNRDPAMLVVGTGNLISARLAALGDGTFLVAWRACDERLVARRVDPEGHWVDAEPVTLAEASQVRAWPNLRIVVDGSSFVVSWNTSTDGLPTGTSYLHVAADGSPGPTRALEALPTASVLRCVAGGCFFAAADQIVFVPTGGSTATIRRDAALYAFDAFELPDGGLEVLGSCEAAPGELCSRRVRPDGTLGTLVRWSGGWSGPLVPAGDGTWIVGGGGTILRVDPAGPTVEIAVPACEGFPVILGVSSRGRAVALACQNAAGDVSWASLNDDATAVGDPISFVLRGIPSESSPSLCGSHDRMWIRWHDGDEHRIAEVTELSLVSPGRDVYSTRCTAGRSTLAVDDGLRSMVDLSLRSPIELTVPLVFDGERFVAFDYDLGVRMRELTESGELTWVGPLLSDRDYTAWLLGASPTHRAYINDEGVSVVVRNEGAARRVVLPAPPVLGTVIGDRLVVLGSRETGQWLAEVDLPSAEAIWARDLTVPMADVGMLGALGSDVVAVTFGHAPDGAALAYGTRASIDGNHLAGFTLDLDPTASPSMACTAERCVFAQTRLDETLGARRVALRDLTFVPDGDDCDADVDCASWRCRGGSCVGADWTPIDSSVEGVGDAGLDAGAPESDAAAILDSAPPAAPEWAPGGGGSCACGISRGRVDTAAGALSLLLALGLLRGRRSHRRRARQS